MSGYNTNNHTHTFPKAFTSNPKVFLQVVYIGDWSTGFGTVKAGSVTKTQFIQVFSISCFWTAIGY